MSKEESVEPAPAKPATPPPKPAAAKAAAAPASSKTAVPRRSLLSWVTLAWVAFTASMLASLTATARFMFPNVLFEDRKSTRLNSSHLVISYAVFCLKKKNFLFYVVQLFYLREVL